MFNAAWVDEVASSVQLPTLSKAVGETLKSLTEMQIHKIVSLARKYQRRAHHQILTVDHINLALYSLGIEEIYGLTNTSSICGTSNSQSTSQTLTTNSDSVVGLVDIGSHIDVEPPFMPEINIHWLAVDGVQPIIPENPLPALLNINVNRKSLQKSDLNKKSIRLFSELNDEEVTVEKDEHAFPSMLSVEMQNFYYRCVSILTDKAISKANETEGNDTRANETVNDYVNTLCRVFRTNAGFQELLPYFIDFFCKQCGTLIVTNSTHALLQLINIVRVIYSLAQNEHINLEFHVQKLVQVLLSTVVGGINMSTATKVSLKLKEVHELRWKLRQYSAYVINKLCLKYCAFIPDLTARVCKTYSDCFDLSRELVTVYGGIVGLTSMGFLSIKSLLMPKVEVIVQSIRCHKDQLKGLEMELESTMQNSSKSTDTKSVSKLRKNLKLLRSKCGNCDIALVNALGVYLSNCMLSDSYDITKWNSTKMELDTVPRVVTVKMDPKRSSDESKPEINPALNKTAQRQLNYRQSLREEKDKRALRMVQNQCAHYEELFEDYAELLIPYYCKESRDLTYCKLWV